MREILDGPVPAEAFALHTAAATMFELGFAEDARRLESYGERTAFLHLLNRPYTPAATVREALKQEATAPVSLDQLRTDFMHEGYSIQASTAEDKQGPDRRMADLGRGTAGVEIVSLQPGLWGAFDARVTHSTGHSIGDAYFLFVSALIRNKTVESGQFELGIPVGGRMPMRCKFGSVAPGGTGQVYCLVDMVSVPQDKERIIATLIRMLSGGPINDASSYGFRPDAFPFRVTNQTVAQSANPAERFGADARTAAQHIIAGAGCRKLGTCGGVFEGYATNSGAWGLAVTTLFMVWTVSRQWHGTGGRGRVFFYLFIIYFLLVTLAAALSLIDPPASAMPSRYYAGLFSSLAVGLLSMPWSYFKHLLDGAAPYAALRDLNSHDFALQWFFVLVNLSYLGLMALFSRLPKRR